MSTIAPVTKHQPVDAWAEETLEPEFTPLSAQEAQALRERDPSLSPWWVVLGQVGVGLLLSLGVWLGSGKANWAMSVAYGAFTVALPAALFARGITGRLSSVNPGSAVFGFFFWEVVKIALTVAMLVAAPKLIEALSWPALLVGLVVTMKVYWVALAFRKKGAGTNQVLKQE